MEWRCKVFVWCKREMWWHLSPRSRRSTCCRPPAAFWTGWPGAARSASGPSPSPSGSSCSRLQRDSVAKKTPLRESVVGGEKFLIKEHNQRDERLRVGIWKHPEPESALRPHEAERWRGDAPDWTTPLTSRDARRFLWIKFYISMKNWLSALKFIH